MINNGSQLRDKGIKQAVNNADDTHEKWSEKAYKFLTVLSISSIITI